jgi:hypothetical protein
MTTIEQKLEKLEGAAKGFYQNEIKKLHNKLDIAIENFEREFGKKVEAPAEAEAVKVEVEVEKVAETETSEAEKVDEVAEEKGKSLFERFKGNVGL